jgi:hypothetical protein
VVGLDQTSVLGQNAVPSPPGGGAGVVPNLNVFNNAYGPEQCLAPSAPGKCEQFDVAPGEENADVSSREWLGRYIDMYRAGMLKGGLLGQMPQQQLGESLPGTAPPPGTNIPRGWFSSNPTRRHRRTGRLPRLRRRVHRRCCLRHQQANGLSANKFQHDGVTSKGM